MAVLAAIFKNGRNAYIKSLITRLSIGLETKIWCLYVCFQGSGNPIRTKYVVYLVSNIFNINIHDILRSDL